MFGIWGSKNVRHFGHSVIVLGGNAAVDPGLHHFWWHESRTDDNAAQARKIGRRPIRMLEKRAGEMRRAQHQCHALFLNAPEHFAGIELFKDSDPPPHVECRQRLDHQPAHMKHRKECQNVVGSTHAPAVVRIDRRECDCILREDRTLGCSCRARRIGDQGRNVLITVGVAPNRFGSTDDLEEIDPVHSRFRWTKMDHLCRTVPDALVCSLGEVRTGE